VAAHFFPSQSIPFTLDTGEDVQLRGRIDRIDVDHKQNCARILDYKTGKAPSGCFAGGTALQLSLYLFAAQYLRPDLTWVSSEYTSVDGSAQTQKSVFPMETLTSALGTLRTIVARLAEGISSGQFFLAPDSCMPCAFPQICTAHGLIRAGEKLQDQRTAAWRWVRTQA
jgi:RecB family exonuclease